MKLGSIWVIGIITIFIIGFGCAGWARNTNTTTDSVKNVLEGFIKKDAPKDQQKKSAEPAKTNEKNSETKTEKSDITSDTAASGLKQALEVGIQNAVKLVGVKDGFYKNDLIKIPLPGKFQKIDTMVRKLGGSAISEALVEKMNRAAEAAAPKAEEIFVSAIKDMSIDDAMGILSGGDNAATKYLEGKTSDSLKSAFYPVIKDSMEEVGAIKTYNDYIGKYKSNPLMQLADIDLDISKYVTGKSIDGLFTMVAKEEAKIRQNPAARVTDLLKSVFGK